LDTKQVPRRSAAGLANITALLPRRPAAARLGVTFGALLLGWAAVPVLLGAGGLGVFVALMVSLGLGFVLSLMLPIMHEATHGAIARSGFTNRLVGWIAGALLLVDFAAYRSTHLRHHCIAGQSGDPEEPVVLRNVQDYFLNLTPWYFLVPFWHLSWKWLCEPPTKKPRVGQLGLVFFAMVIILSTALWPAAFAVGYWVPLFASAGFMFITTAHEHVPLNGDTVPLTRTVRTCPILEFLLWNSNYHVAHHEYPSAPFENLPHLERRAHSPQTRCVKGFTQFQASLLREARGRC
jgi:fatty acid desaturase